LQRRNKITFAGSVPVLAYERDICNQWYDCLKSIENLGSTSVGMGVFLSISGSALISLRKACCSCNISKKTNHMKGKIYKMRKAYDTILQSEVSADFVAQSGGFEPYRFECACCGEEVFIAAHDSTKMVAHFRHRSGNNDVECENYLGQHGALSTDSRSKKSNRETAEFYYENTKKTFSVGVRFGEDDIRDYERQFVDFEVRTSETETPFFVLRINSTNFSPDGPNLITLDRFSYDYYLSSTLNRSPRKHKLFNRNGTPTFFRILGNDNDNDFTAKLVRSNILYTDTRYLVIFQNRYSSPQGVPFPNDMPVTDLLRFETMNRKFLGLILSITKKTASIESALSDWGYQLETSEKLTLLWPPAAEANGASVVYSDYAFLYSSFKLQAPGTINACSDDISTITDKISKVCIRLRTRVFRKNAEFIIAKGKINSSKFDVITPKEITSNTFTVPEDSTHFLFGPSGVKPLCKEQTVFLTPRSEIRHYCFGYQIERILPYLPRELCDEPLLNDILTHYRRTEAFDQICFSSYPLSKIASQYIEKCKETGQINTMAKRFIEEGLL